jgi:cysteinyl-tRNA synthetase
VPKEISGFAENIAAALDDDLNTSVCLAHTAELLSAINLLCDQAMAKKGQASAAAVQAARGALETLRAVLGIGTGDAEQFLRRVRDRKAKKLGIDIASVEQQIQARSDARQDKDFARADEIRGALEKMGVEMFDSPSGTSWRLVVSQENATTAN